MAVVGLKFDLSAWRTGIRDAGQMVKRGLGDDLLTPFQRALKRTTDQIDKGFAGVFARVRKGASGFFGSFLGQYASMLTFQGAVTAIRDAFVGAMNAADAYGDSVTTLQAALRTINDVNVGAATKQVQALGQQLRLALGVTGTEANNAFATFVTRGLDVEAAKQLTILAATYARKAGKPIKDVTKQIADAATGSIDAMKELGLQIAATGDRTVDAERAVLALKQAYGDIGTELVDPADRLSAAWNELAVGLGQRLLPIVEPLVTGFADLVTGLTQTERGREIIDGIAASVQTAINVVSGLVSGISSLSDAFDASLNNVLDLAELVVAKIQEMILSGLDAVLSALPGGESVRDALGLDGLAEAAAIARRDSEVAMENVTRNVNRGFDAAGSFLAGDGGRTGQAARDLMDEGRRIRERATAELNAQIAATRNDTFAGAPAVERARMQERERARQELERRLSGSLAPNDVRATVPSITDGTRIELRTVGPDRFARAY